MTMTGKEVGAIFPNALISAPRDIARSETKRALSRLIPEMYWKSFHLRQQDREYVPG